MRDGLATVSRNSSMDPGRRPNREMSRTSDDRDL
jgi:hypothetical protein